MPQLSSVKTSRSKLSFEIILKTILDTLTFMVKNKISQKQILTVVMGEAGLLCLSSKFELLPFLDLGICGDNSY